MSIWIKDPYTGQPSITVTAFVSGFLVCIFKLAVSGLTLGSVQMSVFTGTDFATAVGALGAVYSLQTHVNNLAAAKNSNIESGNN